MRRAVAMIVFGWAMAAGAQQPQALSLLKGVGIDQNLGAQVPLDAQFRDESGQTVRLGDYFGKRPVLLNLVYFKCPGLCTQVLNDVSRSMNGLAESAGEAFEVVTVSFDPREGPELAAAKKENYLRSYRRPTAEAGWHFLTGPQDSIDRLTRAVGFRYRWDARNQVFAHATAIIVLTPGGKVSRYFYGVEAPPTDLHNAILSAGRDAVGRRVDEVLLYCFHYDPATGRWGVIVSRLLKVLGAGTVLCLGGFVWWQVARERRGSAALRAAAKRAFPNPGGRGNGTPLPVAFAREDHGQTSLPMPPNEHEGDRESGRVA
jgi:protein SCO1